MPLKYCGLQSLSGGDKLIRADITGAAAKPMKTPRRLLQIAARQAFADLQAGVAEFPVEAFQQTEKERSVASERLFGPGRVQAGDRGEGGSRCGARFRVARLRSHCARFQCVDEQLEVNRLGHEIIGSCKKHLMPLPIQNAGGQGDDGQIGEAQFTPDGANRGQSIHDGHLDIHQDGVNGRFCILQNVQRLATVLGSHNLRPLCAEQPLDDVAIYLAIVHDQTT